MPAIKVDSAAIKKYQASVTDYEKQAAHEGNTSRAFANLLEESAREVRGWDLVREVSTRLNNGKTIRYDGVVRDQYLSYGYWEAKDSSDDLNTIIPEKIKDGYSTSNIIFEDTRRAVLYQAGAKELEADTRNPEQLARLLNRFFEYDISAFKTFREAIGAFKDKVREIGLTLQDRITAAHEHNPAFNKAFEEFHELCKKALNPNIAPAAIDEMLIQHMLTERLIRSVFELDDWKK